MLAQLPQRRNLQQHLERRGLQQQSGEQHSVRQPGLRQREAQQSGVKQRGVKKSLKRIIGGLTAIFALVLGAAPAQAVDLQTVTDNYLFSTSLTQFSQIRTSHPFDSQLDWSSDACSYSPDRPFGYDFTAACSRHDFGYRNFKKQSRFTEVNRKRIDDLFYSDMKQSCGGSLTCYGTAWTYYQAVRAFGS